MKFVFITPAYGRFELTDIVYAQRADALAKLRLRGHEADAIVMADDGNLQLAKRHGLIPYRISNDVGIAAKFNAGHKEAAAMGADFTVPVGSDTWLDVDWLTNCDLDLDTVYRSRHYCIIDKSGERRHQLWIDYATGVHQCIPTQLLKSCDYAPIPPELPRGCDSQTWIWLRDNTDAKHQWSEDHPFEAVAFRSEQQISKDKRLFNLWRTGSTNAPFTFLRDYYPEELVERIKQLYKERDPVLGDLYKRLRWLETR